MAEAVPAVRLEERPELAQELLLIPVAILVYKADNLRARPQHDA